MCLKTLIGGLTPYQMSAAMALIENEMPRVTSEATNFGTGYSAHQHEVVAEIESQLITRDPELRKRTAQVVFDVLNTCVTDPQVSIKVRRGEFELVRPARSS